MKLYVSDYDSLRRNRSLGALTLAGEDLRFSRLITGRAPKKHSIQKCTFLVESVASSERHDFPPCTYARMGDSIKRKSLCVMATSGGFFSGGSSHFSPQCFFCMAPPARHFFQRVYGNLAANVRDHRAAASQPVGVSLLLIFLYHPPSLFTLNFSHTPGNK